MPCSVYDHDSLETRNLNRHYTIRIFLFLGKTEFSPDEDAHVVGDCIKVLFMLFDSICDYYA